MGHACAVVDFVAHITHMTTGRMSWWAGLFRQGLAGNNFSDTALGQCFLVQDDCDASSGQKTYADGVYDTFCMDITQCIRAEPSEGDEPINPFDSHICFAAKPIEVSDGIPLIYYMGGNGPHDGWRNTSLGLATLPSVHRFAGIGGSGRVTASVETLVTGSQLTVTADSLTYGATASGSSLRVGVQDVEGLSVEDAVPISLKKANVTEEVATFVSGMDFDGLVGKNVTFEMELVDAMVYSLGFTD